MFPSQHTELPHLQHRLHKLFKKQTLVLRKGFHDIPRPLVRVQILVRREQALAVHQVNVVLVVEGFGRPDIEHDGVVGVGFGAGFLEVLSEVFFHCRVLSGIEALREGAAVAYADGVAAREGHEVSGVKVLGGQKGKEDTGVGSWGWKVVYSCISCCEGKPISPPQWHVVIGTSRLQQQRKYKIPSIIMSARNSNQSC